MMAEEKYICEDCKKSGLFSENHNDCEKLYIDTRKRVGIERTLTDCQCENIGHGWNVTTTMKVDDDPNWLRNHNNTSGDSKSFTNEKWCDVADVIQTKYNFLFNVRENEIIFAKTKLTNNRNLKFS